MNDSLVKVTTTPAEEGKNILYIALLECNKGKSLHARKDNFIAEVTILLKHTCPSMWSGLRSLWSTAGVSAYMSKRLTSCDSRRGYKSAPTLKAHGRSGGAQRQLWHFWAAGLVAGVSSTFRGYRKFGRFSKSTSEILLSPPTASSLRTIVILPDNARNNLRYSKESGLFQSTYLMCFQKLWY